jgi:hypothetical protein
MLLSITKRILLKQGRGSDCRRSQGGALSPPSIGLILI